jgi:hypothetical protein
MLAVTTPRAFAGQAWEVEVHGGALVATNPTAGTIAMPPRSPDIPPAFPQQTFTIEPVPSWFFGEGARLLSAAVPARFGVGIVSLDPVLTSRLAERRSGASFGVRVGRSLSRRFGAEFSLDRASGQLALMPRTIDRIDASEASFLATWNALLNAVFPGGATVNADVTVDDKHGSQLMATGALLINVLSSDAVQPYITVGAGYIDAHNDGPSVTLTGNYRFTQIDQTDTVRIRSTAKNSMTWVVGGG